MKQCVYVFFCILIIGRVFGESIFLVFGKYFLIIGQFQLIGRQVFGERVVQFVIFCIMIQFWFVGKQNIFKVFLEVLLIFWVRIQVFRFFVLGNRLKNSFCCYLLDVYICKGCGDGYFGKNENLQFFFLLMYEGQSLVMDIYDLKIDVIEVSSLVFVIIYLLQIFEF